MTLIGVRFRRQTSNVADRSTHKFVAWKSLVNAHACTLPVVVTDSFSGNSERN